MIITNSILIAMGLLGAVDTLYYHEYKLKLATQISANRELKLHAIRDFIYTILFSSLAWVQLHGWLVVLVMVILLIEITLTLADFIVESSTRILPSVERSMHAVMGIVFGIFLGQLFSELFKWWSMPTEIQFINYGLASWILSLMAIGVFLSGVRDLGSSIFKKEWPRIWSNAQ